MFRLITALTLFGLLLPLAATPALAQSSALQELARKQLQDLQPISIRQNREFCGVIGRAKDGRLIAGPIRRGKRARCQVGELPPNTTLVATFHTHGSYLRRFDNEVPSIIDFETEIALGSIGYVSTPGGRFWMVNGPKAEVRLICGVGCLPWDPNFKDQEEKLGKIRDRYTRKQLYARFKATPFGFELCDGQLCTSKEQE